MTGLALKVHLAGMTVKPLCDCWGSSLIFFCWVGSLHPLEKGSGREHISQHLFEHPAIEHLNPLLGSVFQTELSLPSCLPAIHINFSSAKLSVWTTCV